MEHSGKNGQWRAWFRDGVAWRSLRARRVLRRLMGVQSVQWARVVMDRATAEFALRLDKSKLEALEISGSKWESFGFRSYRSVHFPAFDICATPPRSAAYDIIIAEQVLEHVKWPYRAARNVHAMLRPGGWFIVTTPFLLRLHREPNDCTRWSEEGMRYLLAESGFRLENIETGSWGNRACVRGNFKRWSRWIPWLHTLKNEPDYPVVVWAFARKAVEYG
jgi:SAM-dependent methyltransferase